MRNVKVMEPKKKWLRTVKNVEINGKCQKFYFFVGFMQNKYEKI